ncbi:MAG TPA: RidA family protein [Candidatus Limnocylindria bacterium]|nr:RidA family protein [Candidatus Limnocylindria bacterium]
MAIQRFDSVPGMSRAVIHNGVIYFTGHGARPEFTTPRDQAQAVLARMDELLLRFGSDREHVLNAFLFVSDMRHYEEIASVWREWIPAQFAPASTLVEAKLSHEYLFLEVTLTAAVKETPGETEGNDG